MEKFSQHFLHKCRRGHKSPQSGSGLLSAYAEEYVRFCIEQDQVISTLEMQLHTSDDPEKIARLALQTACIFYGGDWAGVFEVDMDLGIWTPVWWHKREGKDHTVELVQEFENLTVMPTWINAMKKGECLVIPDAGDIQSTTLAERSVYHRLSVKSIIATPFSPNPRGFLVIRNPKRYMKFTTMMVVSAYVLHRAMAQQKEINRAKMSLTPDSLRNDKDIIINFFGNMEICTSKGVLREQDFKSPKSSRVATYLMLHRKATHPPLEIAAALWPEDTGDPDAISNSIRGHIYRFRQAFSLISDCQLIETTPNGYRLNPELHIMTDLQQFDTLWESTQKAVSTLQKIELLKEAFALYRGPVFENADGEHWIASLTTHYSLRYIGLVNELLAALAAAKDYAELQHYAVRAYEIVPHNVKIRFWIIFAMYHLGALEMAKGEIEHAKADFSPEEFDALVDLLKQCEELPLREMLE